VRQEWDIGETRRVGMRGWGERGKGEEVRRGRSF
jgi:hypothetical protein